ncbi:MAG TPA: hypothetical protein VNA27_16445 [Rubrobacteraceae bacterium]|nr:hypothetical protein [Rubrobacteraceae bacterium]
MRRTTRALLLALPLIATGCGGSDGEQIKEDEGKEEQRKEETTKGKEKTK